jgi:hypothetical protein
MAKPQGLPNFTKTQAPPQPGLCTVQVAAKRSALDAAHTPGSCACRVADRRGRAGYLAPRHSGHGLQKVAARPS